MGGDRRRAGLNSWAIRESRHLAPSPACLTVPVRPSRSSQPSRGEPSGLWLGLVHKTAGSFRGRAGAALAAACRPCL
jgi:hypothetical protein